MLKSKQQLVNNLKSLLPGIVYSSVPKKPFEVIAIDGNVEKITGYTEQDFISQKVTLLNIIHPDDLADITEEKQRVIVNPGSFQFEYRVVKKNSDVIWVNESGYVSDEFEIYGFINFQFVEGRRHQQLIDAQRLVLQVASSNEVATGQIIEVARMICQACTKWLGVERASVWLLDPSHSELELVTLYLESKDEFISGITLSRAQYPNYFEALTSGRAIDAVYASVDPRTNEFAIGYLDELNIKSMLDAAVRNGDSILGVICCEQTVENKLWSLDDINFAAELADQFSQTISNRERIYAREQALNAKASNLAKSSFLATISHEIRTPLNGVIGMLDLLNDTRLSKPQKELVGTIQSSGNQLLSVVNDVLDYSRIEAGKINIKLKPVEIISLIEESWSIFQKTASEKQLQLKIISKQAIPMLMIDRLRLKQVLSNLISNAIKFSANENVLIQLELESNYLNLSVQDFGKGMSVNLQSRLFNPFEQEKLTIDGEVAEGSGLGLAISKNIVEAMNGEISAVSEIGKGSIFKVKLPVKVVQQQSPQDSHDQLVTHPASFSEINVWIAEDNVVNQLVIRGMLKRQAISTKLFHNGQQLLDALSETGVKPDLILMDCEMPILDGISAAKLIKADPQLNNIPIAALTAHVLTDFKEKTHEAGMEYFLAKPILKEELYSILLAVKTSKQAKNIKAS